MQLFPNFVFLIIRKCIPFTELFKNKMTKFMWVNFNCPCVQGTHLDICRMESFACELDYLYSQLPIYLLYSLSDSSPLLHTFTILPNVRSTNLVEKLIQICTVKTWMGLQILKIKWDCLHNVSPHVTFLTCITLIYLTSLSLFSLLWCLQY